MEFVIFYEIRNTLLIIICLSGSMSAQIKDNLTLASFPAAHGLNQLSFSAVYPDSFDPLDKKINYTNLAIFGGVNLSAFAAAHIYQAHVWWNMFAPNHGFRAGWEPDYALAFDKEGHAMAAHFLSNYVSSIFESANYDSESAHLYAAGISMFYEIYIEIMDGTSKGYIFDCGDLTADMTGTLYALSQYYFPYLKNFQPRISYWPSPTIRNGSKEHNVFDDYAGQKHWIAVRMKEILPKGLAQYWPSFLMLSVGTALENYFMNYRLLRRELYIAFDFDPTVIPLYGQFWQFVKNVLCYVHFPLPGLRLVPRVSLFGFSY
jgi:Predicted periplasmic lipoprotein (DUF2279)